MTTDNRRRFERVKYYEGKEVNTNKLIDASKKLLAISNLNRVVCYRSEYLSKKTLLNRDVVEVLIYNQVELSA